MRIVLGILVLMLVGGQVGSQDNNFQLSEHSTTRLSTLHRADDKLSAADYEKLTVSGPVVLIDFYAPWCGPCKIMEPIMDELAKEKNGKVQVVRINIDENRNLIRSMEIFEIPAMKVYKHGKLTWSGVGVIEKRIINKQLRKL